MQCNVMRYYKGNFFVAQSACYKFNAASIVGPREIEPGNFR